MCGIIGIISNSDVADVAKGEGVEETEEGKKEILNGKKE